MKYWLAILAVTASMLVGIVLGRSTAAQPVLAQSMGSMEMKMPSKSASDEQMNAAMTRMMKKMSTMDVTGDTDHDFMMMMMIPHHVAAVEMAQVELKHGHNMRVKRLARDVVESQSKEITEMTAWLKASNH